ncbi:YdeI/OmpD-associated family protein [Phaeobacter inhibens]|uniref:YdeI/OmpD-associated family protein n=1 Tax=Phaeobacter inhibens TaxID=221822 RepID=UPI0018F45FC9|nr:YdeI/OmpD-associated family protein [Phaeobacter inhibens]
MRYAVKGLKAPKDTTEPDFPTERVDALAADPEMAETFDNLAGGRRKSYIPNLNSAKQSETGSRRIAGFHEKIIAGKGALDQ